MIELNIKTQIDGRKKKCLMKASSVQSTTTGFILIAYYLLNTSVPQCSTNQRAYSFEQPEIYDY